jgi:hypothetical protein
MTEREMVILDHDVIERVDMNRGDLSRSEFISFCIDNLLDEALSGGARIKGEKTIDSRYVGEEVMSAYTTTVDFEQLKHDLKDIMNVFLEIVLNLGLELDRSQGKDIDELEHLQARIHKIFGEE